MEKRSLWQRIKTPPQLPVKWSWVLTLGLLLLSSVVLTFLCLLIGTLNLNWGCFVAYLDDPVILLLNITPIFLTLFLSYVLDNKAWVAFVTTGTVFGLLCLANYYKVMLWGEPFTLSDFTLVQEGTGVAKASEFPPHTGIVLVLGVLIVGALLLARYGRAHFPKKLGWMRLLLVILIIVLGVSAWNNWYRDTDLYDKMLYVNDGPFQVEKDTDHYASKGVIYSFLHSVSEAFPIAPEGYSPQTATEILGRYENLSIPENQKVNIVVTMLENFSDLSVFDSISLTADPYGAWHKLERESRSGLLITDGNSERSFLTGFADAHPSYRGMTNSFVHTFRAMDYQTDGAYAGADWVNRRGAVNRRLGFERYLFADDMTGLTEKEIFTSLRHMYGAATAESKPYFSFSVLPQTQSRYSTTSLDGGEFLSKTGLNEATYYCMNNYLNGLKNTAEEVSAYVDSFRNDKEPVVMLFFGSQKADFRQYYGDLGLNTQSDTPDGCWDLCTTPYLIWANDAAKAILGDNFRGTGDTLSPAFLMAELFEVCGWEGTAWMQYQREVAEVLPVIHGNGMAMENGKLTSVLSTAAQRVYDEFQIVQYYMRDEYIRYYTNS